MAPRESPASRVRPVTAGRFEGCVPRPYGLAPRPVIVVFVHPRRRARLIRPEHPVFKLQLRLVAPLSRVNPSRQSLDGKLNAALIGFSNPAGLERICVSGRWALFSPGLALKVLKDGGLGGLVASVSPLKKPNRQVVLRLLICVLKRALRGGAMPLPPPWSLPKARRRSVDESARNHVYGRRSPSRPPHGATVSAPRARARLPRPAA